MVSPLTFELCYRREAYDKIAGNLIRNEERDAKIPETPAGFKPMIGAWSPIAERADKLNKTQERSGYLDYFFFPDLPKPVTS